MNSDLQEREELFLGNTFLKGKGTDSPSMPVIAQYEDEKNVKGGGTIFVVVNLDNEYIYELSYKDVVFDLDKMVGNVKKMRLAAMEAAMKGQGIIARQ